MKNKLFVLLFAINGIFISSALAKIKILNPWVSASMGSNASLFMHIVNTSRKPVKLVGAQASISSHTVLQSHQNEENELATVAFIIIPSKGNIILKPEGYHILLEDINRPLKVGDSVRISLEFDDEESIDVVAPVREAASE